MKPKLTPMRKRFSTERLPLEVCIGTGSEYISEWTFRSFNVRDTYLISLRHIDCCNIVKEEHFMVSSRIIMRKFLLGFLYGRPYYDEHTICSSVNYNSDSVRYVTFTKAHESKGIAFKPFDVDSVIETLGLDNTWKDEIMDHIEWCMSQIDSEE